MFKHAGALREKRILTFALPGDVLDFLSLFLPFVRAYRKWQAF